ncbi:hypothetical protein LCGC14_0774120 [marine sediment metagenome]|uniref:Uncharacterized protein n=1 Tax=marine sediment metagenome TaxID=412755 RepID=A0A0F9Q1L1_9ZZZZ
MKLKTTGICRNCHQDFGEHEGRYCCGQRVKIFTPFPPVELLLEEIIKNLKGGDERNGRE